MDDTLAFRDYGAHQRRVHVDVRSGVDSSRIRIKSSIQVEIPLPSMSYAEIASSLGVTVGTIKSRLTRARQTLRRGLRVTHV
jgi:hypothetical protein